MLFGFPIFCLIIIIASILIALTAVLWMPIITLLVQIMNALVYDADSPLPDINRFFILFEVLIINIGILGILQPIVAVFVGAVVCPLIALMIAIGE